MHTREMTESEGTFDGDWRPTRAENPDFRCRTCGSDDVWYRTWESDCGGYVDTKYRCRHCGRTWWVEGPDA
jgi:DNA-directed RNA polymerase subunit M/transcription elongation factor TFIIS